MKDFAKINEFPSGSRPRPGRRGLEWWEIQELERQGCSSDDWQRVSIDPATDLRRIRNVEFRGSVTLGSLAPGAGALSSALLEDVETGDGVTVRNVPGGVRNCRIGDGAVIENTARVAFDREAPCGVGTVVGVLDETGGRPVKIYPGLSAQMAVLMARMPREAEEKFIPLVDRAIEALDLPLGSIGAGAVIRDCGPLTDVTVWPGVTVEGASALRNGCVVNNAGSSRALAYIGHGVDAENFIIEDGRVMAGAILRNCYVGQGAEIDKGFTAHDSLFFANCSMENGEACAVLAGPYSVSMHKSTLLIGCQTSFMNAGSATNQSNHMYKLGPVHWGILERGVKTSSNSYLMLGATIGAFSLLMGDHKTHPDSSEFPFSYLFGDDKGATVVVPAMMLRSCGLLRDEKKWPTRDRRLKRRLPLLDRIHFEVLNPVTVHRMLLAIDVIAELLTRPADDDRYLRYKGMKISRASLERARMIYILAIFKYLHLRLGAGPIPEPPVDAAGDPEAPSLWLDLGGQLIERSTLDEVCAAESLEEMEDILSGAFARYEERELRWIASRFGRWWRERQDRIPVEAGRFDEMVDEDRESYRANLAAENARQSL